MTDLDKMLALARQAQQHSYSPYSHFPVGACIKSAQGQYYAGCNVENASYGLTHCAEANAIGTMVAQGEQKISEVLVIGPNDILCYPCGSCRQRLSEFATPDCLVHIADQNGIRQQLSMAELLPYAFTEKNLRES
jgi:cytidine deaminase